MGKEDSKMELDRGTTNSELLPLKIEIGSRMGRGVIIAYCYLPIEYQRTFSISHAPYYVYLGLYMYVLLFIITTLY